MSVRLQPLDRLEMMWGAVWRHISVVMICALILYAALQIPVASSHKLTDDRIVFQTKLGDLEFGLYPEVAPVTAAHILQLAKLGAYNTVSFFRVDRGFVAQCTDIVGNRKLPLDKLQEAEALKKVPLEVQPDAKHDRRGILSMARWDDPNSGGASFSITLGPAPHLDMQYTVFGELTAGWQTLDEFEKQETKKEGIFVMPKEPIEIQSTYVKPVDLIGKGEAHRLDVADASSSTCPQELQMLQQRFDAQAAELQRLRSLRLPG